MTVEEVTSTAGGEEMTAPARKVLIERRS